MNGRWTHYHLYMKWIWRKMQSDILNAFAFNYIYIVFCFVLHVCHTLCVVDTLHKWLVKNVNRNRIFENICVRAYIGCLCVCAFLFVFSFSCEAWGCLPFYVQIAWSVVWLFVLFCCWKQVVLIHPVARVQYLSKLAEATKWLSRKAMELVEPSSLTMGKINILAVSGLLSLIQIGAVGWKPFVDIC